MNEPNNTTTAYGFSQMRTERPPATSPAVIVWMAFGLSLCCFLTIAAAILF